MAALAGRVALITGASGGIGGAIARALAAEGAALALHYGRNAGAAKTLAKRLSADGARCALLQADLSRPGAPARLVAACLKAFGRLDVLVNNAGAAIGPAHFLKLSERDWEATLRLNAQAPFFLAREAFRAMKERGGRIINISSVGAKFGGSPKTMHYGAAKAAVEAFTRGLGREGAPYNILVNTVRPGVIDTGFHARALKDMRKRRLLIPLKRFGKPDDVARMVAHLAGPGGDFITRQVLEVSGGE